jgi:hypothetical protein
MPWLYLLLILVALLAAMYVVARRYRDRTTS